MTPDHVVGTAWYKWIAGFKKPLSFRSSIDKMDLAAGKMASDIIGPKQQLYFH